MMETVKAISNINRIYFFIAISINLFLNVNTQELLDTREGEDLALRCRFNEQHSTNEFLYYWARATGTKYENVAIGEVPLNTNYRLDFRPENGIYDLQIKNASYSRDNGRFECRVKAVGTGADVHQDYYNLTVLTQPQPPTIAPGSVTVATEKKVLSLTCTSIGGSPDPTITWFREGNKDPLPAMVTKVTSEHRTVSTLTMTAQREDDGTRFHCIVWNRAMSEGQRLEATLELSVNYFPRISVGPENPLRIERDEPATLECSVDAKPKVNNVRWTRNGRFIGASLSHTIHRVSLQDAGKYACSADNGLGHTGEQELLLDVLYPPIVVIEAKSKEAEEHGSINIRCNATSNPPPNLIEWFKEGTNERFRSGDTLTLHNIRASDAGNYLCMATNEMQLSNGKIINRSGNSTVSLLVRHRPGQAFINPSKPIVHVGNAVTLTCSATPAGWPGSHFQWFKDYDANAANKSIIAQGPQYIIPKAHMMNEGRYHCQAENELGFSVMANITLEVHQQPQFLAKLQQHVTRRIGDNDYTVTCSAKGKPKPSIVWKKDNRDISAIDNNLYEIRTNPVDGGNGMWTIQSTLKFRGSSRPHENELIPGDRGLFTCLFSNEVNEANSSMHLRIEHPPIVLHQYSKVAYDVRENAEVKCKVQAYPKPEFQWQFGNNPATLSMSSEGHYEISTTSDNNDIYTSVLRINNLVPQDYGEYLCRVANSLETLRAPIKLQLKGKPEKPLNLQASDVGSDYVTLNWDPGFDGGIPSTKYFIAYRKVAMPQQYDEQQLMPECYLNTVANTEWLEFDCQQEVPCKVMPLEQHHNYVFKVKALNTKGSSDYSNDIMTVTKVDKIPPPLHVTFDPTSRTLGINVGATCLQLVAIVEYVVNGDSSMAAWQIVETVPLKASGNIPTHKDIIIEHLVTARRSSARSLGITDDNFMAHEDELNPRVRVKLCLKANHEHCGDYTEAEIGSSFVTEATALATPTIIGIAVSCVVFALVVILVLMFCRCKRKQTKKSAQAKDYEMDSVRPSIVAQQNQAPPPYYPASGLENKALEHSMDLALALEEQKTAVYGSQNGYGYHQSQPTLQMSGQHMPGTEWVNMGYIENSYSNSNNGGSVNSQDSLWQLKMSAPNANSANLVVPSHNFVERQPSYGYDPLTHGGYGGVDEYSPYQVTTTSQHGGDDYHTMRNSQNQSRQDYCTDPYAAVHKPKKRHEQHLESPYHDVSGLPDPYMEQMEQDDQKPPIQHMSLNYDDSLESGYSTPNSRNRRVIREIIV